MKKKVYYKLNRYQVTKVEVETVEQEQAVKMLNRDTDRFAKSEDTYRERYASLDEMYEESGFEPADDSPTPEEQFLENEKNEAIKRLVAKAMEELTEKQKIVVYKTFWEQKTLREISRELNAHNKLNSDTEYVTHYANYPTDILKFSRDRNAVHPTQKPVALLEYLIKTYTKEGEVVMDNCMGSGSAGIACGNTGSQFIGIEADDYYFQTAKERIEKGYGN